MREIEVGDFNLEPIESNIHLSVARHRLILKREEEDSNLNECRAMLLLNKKNHIKKNSKCCMCSELPKENFSNEKPFVLRFD